MLPRMKITINKMVEKKVILAHTMEELQEKIDEFVTCPFNDVELCIACGGGGTLYTAMIFYKNTRMN